MLSCSFENLSHISLGVDFSYKAFISVAVPYSSVPQIYLMYKKFYYINRIMAS
jgi:hypothetical protein